MTVARDILERAFRAVEARDRAAFLAAVAPDAEFRDPHYPRPQMTGAAEIAAGLEWGLGVMAQFRFRIVNFFRSEDGLSGAAECDCNHTLKIGRKLAFPQVFVVVTDGTLIRRLQAYEPYGPNGMGGFVLGVTRLSRRLTGKGRRNTIPPTVPGA